MDQHQQQEKVYEKIETESTRLSFADFCTYLIEHVLRSKNFGIVNQIMIYNLITGTPAAKKATLIAIFLGALNQFCGVFVMTSYTNKIFEDAGSTMPSNTASIIVAAVQLLANCVTMILVDRAGRKILICISASGTAVGLVCMGLYDLYKGQLAEFRWISIASFSMIIFMASIGMLPLTYVILSEILPKKVIFLTFRFIYTRSNIPYNLSVFNLVSY